MLCISRKGMSYSDKLAHLHCISKTLRMTHISGWKIEVAMETNVCNSIIHTSLTVKL